MKMRRLSQVLSLLLVSCAASPCPATVTDLVPRAGYPSTGGATCSCVDTDGGAGFATWEKTDLQVHVDDTLQAVDTDYTVSFTAGDASGCSVTFTTAPSSGSSVVLVRDQPRERTTDFGISGPFSLSALNSQLDRLTAQGQDLLEQGDRSLKLPSGSTADAPTLPDPEAGTVLGYNASGTMTNLSLTASSTRDGLADLAGTDSGKGADLVGVPPVGDTGDVLGDVLAERPTLNQWVTGGSGTSSDPWILDVTSLNSHLAADGAGAVARAGRYQTDGPVVVAGNGAWLDGTGMYSSIILSTDETAPVVRVAGLHCRVRNLWLRHENLPTTSETGGYGFSVGSGAGNVAWGDFSNLYITHSYTGIGEELTYTGASFNNAYQNLKIMYWSGWGAYFHQDASGDLFDSLYLNNNWDTGGGAAAQPAVGLITVKGDHDATFKQLNLEHVVTSSSSPIQFGAAAISVDGLHIEDVTYTHAAPFGISFVGTNAQVSLRNVVFNSVVSSAASQTSYHLFRFYGTNLRVNIDNVKLVSDCDFQASGTVYYNYFDPTLDPDSAAVYVRGLLNLTDDTFTFDGGDDTLRPVIRQWNDETWGRAGLNSALYDFSVDGGTVGSIVLAVLPRNATITRAWYEVLTAPTSAGAATIAFGVQTNDPTGLLAATAYSDAAFTAGYHDFLTDGTAANFTVKTTNPRNLIMTIGTADLTGGKIRIWYEVVTSE